MARPNFSVSLPDTVRYVGSGASFTNPVTGTTVSEEVAGTNRHKPQGWVAPTSYSLLRKETSKAYGTSNRYIVPGNWGNYSRRIGAGAAFDSSTHFDAAISEANAILPLSTNTALIKARNKMRRSDVNLGVAFAERKQTARLVGNTAGRLARSILYLKRGKFRYATRELGLPDLFRLNKSGSVPEKWLEMQYGWKPLLSDVYGACDALARRNKSDWIVTAKAGDRDQTDYRYAKYPIGTNYPTSNFDAFTSVATRSRGVFVRLDALPVNDLTMSLSSLGVTNPLLVGWELVPFSFIVDWFLPVGDWLSSLDALLGYGSAYSSITTYNDCRWRENGNSKTWPGGAYISNNWVGTKRVLKVVRSGSSGVPLPTLPRFKDPRSLGHMANGLSLLAMAVSGRKIDTSIYTD